MNQSKGFLFLFYPLKKKRTLNVRKGRKIGLKQFYTIIKTSQINHKSVLNYFNDRSTNASAESFNAKIKYLRIRYRGVRDQSFSCLD
ncbi:transposase [Myroides odoratus]|uniref:transposase n=1 Tax=Myroides odoratus TaxID=256 RepID=UPI0039B0A4A3